MLSPDRNFFRFGDAVRKRILKISAQVIVGLHCHDIGAVGEQQQILRDLQMVRPRVVSSGKEADGF
jgi:hypothetical protein